jgi:SAM-dependent methyltransferase
LTEVRRLEARLESVDRAGLPSASRAAAPPLPRAAPDDEPASALSYLAFEEKHRGPGAAVKEKQRTYLSHFVGVPARVLDAGCGRGEFLEILREGGVPAYGIDLDPEMAARARDKGLDVTTGDLLGHLAALPDGSLGGIFAAQVIEHMVTDELVSFARLAHAKLAPGGRFVAETINPASLATFAGSTSTCAHSRAEGLALSAGGTGFRNALESPPFPGTSSRSSMARGSTTSTGVRAARQRQPRPPAAWSIFKTTPLSPAAEWPLRRWALLASLRRAPAGQAAGLARLASGPF